MNARRSVAGVIGLICAFAGMFALAGTPALALNTHVLSLSFGASGAGAGELSSPDGVAVNTVTHDVYVADVGNRRIDEFSSTGTFIRAWGWGVTDGLPTFETCTEVLGCKQGLEGSSPGEFTTPRFVAVDNSGGASDGDVYVGDTGDNIVSKFSAEGALIESWGTKGQSNGKTLGSPATDGPFETIDGIAVDGSGVLMVMDESLVSGSSLLFRFAQAGSFSEDFVVARASEADGLSVDSEGDFFKANGNRSVEEIADSHSDVGQVTSSSSASGIAVDPATGSLFVDEGGSVEDFMFSGSGVVSEPTGTCTVEPSVGCGASESFGNEELTDGGGMGLSVDSSVGRVYLADASAGRIDVFTPAVLADVTTGQASNITLTSATVEGTIDPENVKTGYFVEYGTTPALGSKTSEVTEWPGDEGTEAKVVSVNLSGLEAGQSGHVWYYRLVAENAQGASHGQTSTFSTVLPGLSEEFSENVLQTSAILHADVNPNGTDATYRFEYGTSTSYGMSIPAAGLEIGAGSSPVAVSQAVTGLALGTAYHYRVVATSSLGTVEGTDHTFTTSSYVSDVLPDERQYELVSPPNKNGGEIDGGVFAVPVKPPQQAAEDGSAVMYESATGFGSEGSPPQPKGDIYHSSYISKRGPNGWSTENITPPITVFGHVGVKNEADTWQAMSADLTAGFTDSNSNLLPEAFEGYFMPYVRSSATGVYRDLSSQPPSDREPGVQSGYPYEGEFLPFFAGGSADFSHVAFSANGALTPNALPDPNPAERNLYEWSNGQLRLVNILPDGRALSPTANPIFGRAHPAEEAIQEEFNEGEAVGPYINVMSNDGSRVFWTDTEDHELFARVDGTSTVRVSQSQKTNGGPPGEDDGAEYQGATPDGSQVFFTSKVELTNEASKPTRDLYRYSMETGQLVDLTPGAEIVNTTIPSEDGSYVYFLANGVLANGASQGDCVGRSEDAGDPEKHCNVYVWHEGAGIRFVTRMTEAESDPYIFVGGGLSRASRVSPNGRYFAFQYREPLPGFENTTKEVFLYDAQGNGGTGSLVCASCNPTGARPLGESLLPGHVGGKLGQPLLEGAEGWKTGYYQQRYLDDNGRLYFQSLDALSPRDTNGQLDVYQYEPPGVGSCTASDPTYDGRAGGCVSLISGGFGPEPSEFYDGSASGNDVFILTRDQLVKADQDQDVDVYDVRVGATPNIAEPPPCASSDACKPGPTPQPTAFGAPASATFSGAGNVAPSSSGIAAGPKQKSASRTRAEDLKRALRVCKAKSRSKRRSCEALARAKYGPRSQKARKSNKRSSGRGK